jgi:hypothetical protein
MFSVDSVCGKVLFRFLTVVVGFLEVGGHDPLRVKIGPFPGGEKA